MCGLIPLFYRVGPGGRRGGWPGSHGEVLALTWGACHAGELWTWPILGCGGGQAIIPIFHKEILLSACLYIPWMQPSFHILLLTPSLPGPCNVPPSQGEISVHKSAGLCISVLGSCFVLHGVRMVENCVWEGVYGVLGRAYFDVC